MEQNHIFAGKCLSCSPICCGKALAAKQGRIICGPSSAIQQELQRALHKDLPGPGTSVPCGTIHRGSDSVATRKAMCKHGTRENMPKKKKHFCAVIFSNAGSHHFAELFLVCAFFKNIPVDTAVPGEASIIS